MGGGKGGSKGPQQVNQTTTNIPEYAKPYVTGMLSQAQSLTTQPYTPYTGNRIAGFNPTQQNAFGATNQLMPQIQQGHGQARSTVQGANYNPDMWTDPGVAQQYMNPFITNVLDSMMGRSQLTMGQQANARNAAAVKRGTFGGSRGAVENAVATDLGNRSLMEQMSNLLQSGYNTANSQFNLDRGAQLDKGKFDLTKGQGIASLTNQSLMDQGRVIDMLKANGLDQQRQTQAGLDLAYTNFQNQRDWGKNNLSFMSSLIHGLPAASDSTVSTQVNRNPYSDALGLGIGAAGLAGALGVK